MALCALMMNSSIQVQARPWVSPVSPLHGMMNSSGKSTVNTRQDRPMISSAKLEKEKTTNNQCLKKFDYRLIYNYFFEIPLCNFLKWRDALSRLRLCQKTEPYYKM